MSRHLKLFSLAVLLALSARAGATDWQLQTADGSRGILLIYGSGQPVSYRFQCAANGVIVTQTGVTKLIDLKTGAPIGDDVDAVMPSGAAMMALYGGKGDPQFTPAEAVKNPAGGWDLTIRLTKKDKHLKAIGRSDMMSLFTTGYTMAVVMDAEARTKWNEFIRYCKAAG